MDKTGLAKKIGALEGQISDGEAQIRKTEEKLSSAKRNRTAGLAVLVVGVLGFVFISNWWIFWAFLFIIGGLTFVTALSNQGAANRERAEQQAWMSKSRATLAEWRALISAP